MQQFFSKVSEIDLFDSLTYLARILRNVCVQSTENQHRVMIAGGLAASLDTLSAAVGLSSKISPETVIGS